MLVLDRRVDIMKPSAALNAIGDPGTYAHESFVLHATVWARRVKRPLAIAERPAGPALHGYALYNYLIRYRDDIFPDMIVKDGGATYRIRQISPRGRKAYLELECEWLAGAV